jgi:hypothetical protein
VAFKSADTRQRVFMRPREVVIGIADPVDSEEVAHDR